MAESSFDQSEPSVIPLQTVISHATHLRDVYWIGKNPAVIRIFCIFRETSCSCSSEKLLYSPNSLYAVLVRLLTRSAEVSYGVTTAVSASRSRANPAAT